MNFVMEAYLLDALTLSRDAFLSQAWIYPLLGISYLVSHPKLYDTLAPVVIKALVTSLGITTAMFFFTYLPQLAFCAVFSGPLAFAAAAVMVLSESYVLVTFVSKVFFLNAAQDRLCKGFLIIWFQMFIQRLQSMPYLCSKATKPLSREAGKSSRTLQVSKFSGNHS
jgi:hypothetical protein